jgi:tetratricopeptide (TPR) repeat protein
MKAQRRHELQRNALGSEIAKAWEFLRRRGNYLAWGALGVVVVIIAIWWYVKHVRSEAESIQSQYAEAVFLNYSQEREGMLDGVAAKTSHSLWAANALVKLGDDLAFQLVVGRPKLSDTQKKELYDSARERYLKAISDFPREASAVAMAHFGLGRLSESEGYLDAARQEYETILRENPSRPWPVVYLANDAINNLSQYRGAVYMPASAPASGPASRSATSSSGAASGPSSRAAASGASEPASPAPSRPASAAAAGAASRP